jgi:hypothetical protein
METLNFTVPLTFEQIMLIVRQLPKSERLQLVKILQKEAKQEKDAIQTHFASESVLAKDWLSEAEEKAWQNL